MLVFDRTLLDTEVVTHRSSTFRMLHGEQTEKTRMPVWQMLRDKMMAQAIDSLDAHPMQPRISHARYVFTT